MKENIQHLIKSRGHTLESFAGAIKWSRMKLYRKLADPKRITIGELATIAKELNTPICYLFRQEI